MFLFVKPHFQSSLYITFRIKVDLTETQEHFSRPKAIKECYQTSHTQKSTVTDTDSLKYGEIVASTIGLLKWNLVGEAFLNL